jgi:subtilase family serine protease
MKRIIPFAVVLALVASLPASSQNRTPDLAVSNDFKVDVVTRKLGTFVSEQILVITATVRNNGDVGASGIPVHMMANGQVIATHHIPALNSAAESKFTVAWRPPESGRYEIRTTVDPTGLIGEASEANNTTAFVLDIAANRHVMVESSGTVNVQLNRLNQSSEPAAILQTGDIDLDFEREPFLSGATPRVGRSGTIINLDVHNHGSVSARNVDIALYINGERQMVRNIGTIPAGRSRHVHLNWTPRMLGEQRLVIVVDPSNKIEESAEANNTVSLDATVISAPARRR